MAKLGAQDSDSHSNPWSSLQGDLLCLVGEKIEFIEDFVSFCAVCRCWYVSGTELYNRGKKKLDFNSPFYTPWFDPRNPNPDFRSHRNYTVDSPPEQRRSWGSWWRSLLGSRSWGSQFGWLVTYSTRNHKFSLVNPFSGSTISLPPFDLRLFDLRDPSWIKAFLTADPVGSPEDCIVLVAHGRFLAFARPTGRDRAWYSIIPSDYGLLTDVMSFRGGLYGITDDSIHGFGVVSIQIEPSPRVVVLVHTGLGPDDYFIDPSQPQENGLLSIKRKYIVELEGELCVVMRYNMERNVPSSFVTGYFKVFRVDMSTGELARVWSLGDRCLFLGNGNTFTWKGEVGSKSNLVVYTHVDDYWFYDKPCNHDDGVWDMSRSEKIYSSTRRLTIHPSSLWFVPSVISFKTLEQLEQEVEEEVEELARSKRKGTARCFLC